MKIDDISWRSTGAVNPLPNLSNYLEAKMEKSEALRAAGPPCSSTERSGKGVGVKIIPASPSPGIPHTEESKLGFAARAHRERNAAAATRAWRALAPQRSRWPDVPEHPEKNTNKQIFMRTVTQLTKASSLSLEMSLLWTSCLANKPHVSTLQNPISEQRDSDRSRDMIHNSKVPLNTCWIGKNNVDVLSNMGCALGKCSSCPVYARAPTYLTPLQHLANYR